MVIVQHRIKIFWNQEKRRTGNECGGILCGMSEKVEAPRTRLSEDERDGTIVVGNSMGKEDRPSYDKGA